MRLLSARARWSRRHADERLPARPLLRQPQPAARAHLESDRDRHVSLCGVVLDDELAVAGDLDRVGDERRPGRGRKGLRRARNRYELLWQINHALEIKLCLPRELARSG